MKNIMIVGLLIGSIGFATTSTAQVQQPKHSKEVVATSKMHYNGPRSEHKTHHHQRPGKLIAGTNSKTIAINKTAALDKKVNLTRKQERKVHKLHKREAKQMVKLQDIRKENRHAMKDILTDQQMQQLKHQRAPRYTHATTVSKDKGHYRHHKNDRIMGQSKERTFKAKAQR